MNLIKVKGTAKLTAQGERVCLKDSKYILFEILGHGRAVQAHVGRASPIWQFGLLGQQFTKKSFKKTRIKNGFNKDCSFYSIFIHENWFQDDYL